MKIDIGDFYLRSIGDGHYRLSFFSPVTQKEWTKTTTDKTLVDEFISTKTSDHTQVRLKWLKSFIKLRKGTEKVFNKSVK